MHVLVTGSAGVIGTAVVSHLRGQGDRVRGFDLKPTGGCDSTVVGNITDLASLEQAMDGIEAVVHLAAIVNDAPMAELLGPNFLGPSNVFEAARLAGVQRVVLASSIQTVCDRQGKVLTTTRRPCNNYGASKCFAEDLGTVYHRKHQIDVISVRVGFVVRNMAEVMRMINGNHYGIYLSANDVGRFFYQAVHAPFSGNLTVYAVGPAGSEHFDMEPAREFLGFEARDVWPSGLGFELPADLECFEELAPS